MASAMLFLLAWLSLSAAASDAVVLTGTVEKQVYCIDRSDDMLRLYLRMQVTNPGPAPAVVYTALRDITYVRIAAKGAPPGGAPLVEFDQSPITVWHDIKPDRFTTLAPGQSVAFEAMVPIQARKDGGATRGSALGPGDYVMSVVVSLWQGDEESAETWRKRLEPRGALVVSGPASLPIAFTVDPTHRAVSCPD
jgi:hypothetical protein